VLQIPGGASQTGSHPNESIFGMNKMVGREDQHGGLRVMGSYVGESQKNARGRLAIAGLQDHLALGRDVSCGRRHPDGLGDDRDASFRRNDPVRTIQRMLEHGRSR
jgi:hypothetical protein